MNSNDNSSVYSDHHPEDIDLSNSDRSFHPVGHYWNKFCDKFCEEVCYILDYLNPPEPEPPEPQFERPGPHNRPRTEPLVPPDPPTDPPAVVHEEPTPSTSSRRAPRRPRPIETPEFKEELSMYYALIPLALWAVLVMIYGPALLAKLLKLEENATSPWVPRLTVLFILIPCVAFVCCLVPTFKELKDVISADCHSFFDEDSRSVRARNARRIDAVA